MKKFKKLLALVVAMTMVMAMGLTAFASETTAEPKGSIEIQNPKTDPNAETTTYEAYKIFDMTTTGETDATSGNYKAVAYTINPTWADFFATGDGAAYLVDSDTDPASLNSITVNGVKKYINITDSNVAEFAKKAFEYAQTKPVAAATSINVNKGATSVKFENLPLGYYMVYPKGASVKSGNYTSIVSISNTAPNGKVAQKAEWPEITKTADDISVEVGQKVTYTISGKVPDTTGYSVYEFTIKDKTSAGLTYDGNNSVKVKIGTQELTAGTDYTFAASPADGNDFELTINLLKAKAGTDPVEYEAKYAYDAVIEVTYTATVNENAITKIDENHATLTYNNDPKDGTKKDTTPPVEVKTYSSKVEIEKVDGANTATKLKGAKFVLRAKTIGTATGDSHETDIAANKYYYYDSTAKDVKWVNVTSEKAEDLAKDSTITVVTTDDEGKAKFEGLENGEYELIEVEAPKGYNLLTTPTPVTIAGSDSDESKLTIKSTIENKSGAQLPSTGGIGTTMFYVFGAALVIGAGVLMVTKRRMAN